jgi:tetratricopeptide (TPR) repeat protein
LKTQDRWDVRLDEGLKFHQTGRLSEAEAIYEEIIQNVAMHVDALHLLGLIRHQSKRFTEAIPLIQQAISAKSTPCQVMQTNLGAAYQANQQLEAAEDCYRRAIQVRADYEPAHQNLARLLGQAGRIIESATARRHLGQVLMDLSKFDEASIQLRLAHELNSDDSQTLHDLATCFARQGRFVEADQAFRGYLERDSKNPLAWTNFGWILAQQGRLTEAGAKFRRAIKIDPNFVDAHLCLSTVLLRQGDFQQGWQEYEWRWKSQASQFQRAARSQPEWQGEPLGDKMLLVESEQGLGDILQFLRYVELLRQRDIRFVVKIPKVLKPLLEECVDWADRLITDMPQAFDAFIPLLSLPKIMETTLESVPNQVPYLRVPSIRTDDWCRRLGPRPKLRVGVVWQGSSAYRDDQYRSFPLRKFAPLSLLPGVELISLQKGDGLEQLSSIDFKIRVPGEPFDQDGPFLDTAAIMKNLDLVIAPNTAVAHLAGALNVPVWLVLSANSADWRWIEKRSDTPWYPSMRIYRQAEASDWDELFFRIYHDAANAAE